MQTFFVSKVGVVTLTTAGLWAIVVAALWMIHGPPHVRADIGRELRRFHISRTVRHHDGLPLTCQPQQA
jgi:hypothetical protein